MDKILELIKQHTDMRKKALNLVASENILSETALNALRSDLNGRYAAELYGGTKIIKEIIDITVNRLKELFKVDYVNVKPVSGTISVIATLLAFTRPGDKVGILNFRDGGFPLNIKGYNRVPVYLPYNNETYTIDAGKAVDLLSEEKPQLVFLGASRIQFSHPVKQVAETVHDYGGIVAYDGSHVMGLIAGRKFQDPLREGADLLIGSTHKTFPGPQGGLILTNDENINKKIEDVLSRPYMLVDNPHVARIAALGVTALEMLKFGESYAANIVKNSKKLAEELAKRGLKVKAARLGYTETHQILLDDVLDGMALKEKLERANIFIDAIGRIGTQEITRRGMLEQDMVKIAELISHAINDRNPENLKGAVAKFASKFNKVHYSLD